MKNKSLLGISDFIWIDYVLLCLYTRNPNNSSAIILSSDFPLCKRKEFIFGILLELYLIGIIDIQYINKNLQRLHTFTGNSRKELQDKIISQNLNPLTYYGFIDNPLFQYEIVFESNSEKLKLYLDERSNNWYSENYPTHAIGAISPAEQIKKLVYFIDKNIRDKNLSYKNFGITVTKFLELDTSELYGKNNPFLALYFLEKNGLIQFSNSDFGNTISDNDCQIIFT